MIEIGVPFSDPIADGPIIQEASHHALIHGVKPQQCVAQLEPLGKFFLTYHSFL